MKHALQAVEFINTINANNKLLARIAEKLEGNDAIRLVYDAELATVFVDQKDKADIIVPLSNVKSMTLKTTNAWAPEKKAKVERPELVINEAEFLRPEKGESLNVSSDIPKAALKKAPKKRQ